MKNYQINITGKVQRTGFHFYVKQLAQLNNIKGYVNHPDESGITIEAEGRVPDLYRFIDFCMIGPKGSVISSTSISEGEIKNYNAFTIRVPDTRGSTKI